MKRLFLWMWVCVGAACSKGVLPPEGGVEPPRLDSSTAGGPISFPQPRRAVEDVVPVVVGIPTALGPAPAKMAEPVPAPARESVAALIHTLAGALDEKNTAVLARIVFSKTEYPELDEALLSDMERDFLEGQRPAFWKRVIGALSAQEFQGVIKDNVVVVPVDVGGALGRIDLRFMREADGSWLLVRN